MYESEAKETRALVPIAKSKERTTGLSETEHRKLIEKMEMQTTQCQLKLVSKDLEQLKLLYADYDSGLEQLRRITREY